MRLLLALPGFAYRECAQGLLGADSAKRTGLLVLNMPRLPIFIRANALCADIPRAQTFGVDAEGNFRTAKLKEYPPAFCRALAAGFLQHLPPDTQEDLHSIPQSFSECCRKLHCTDMGVALGPDYAVR